jgi:hypothetical protein
VKGCDGYGGIQLSGGVSKHDKSMQNRNLKRTLPQFRYCWRTPKTSKKYLKI